MLITKESVLNLKKTTHYIIGFSTFKLPATLKICYDSPVKYYFWRFWYRITRLWNLVQLSIYFTRALFPKYFVAMKLRFDFFEYLFFSF